MKRKLLFAIAALLCSVSSWAYSTTDLTNAGWTSVTNLSSLTLGDYYFVLVDAHASTHSMAHAAPGTTNMPAYMTLQDPTIIPSQLWIIETSGSGYKLKSYVDGKYFNSGSAGWNDSMSDTGTELTFTLSDNKYLISCTTGHAGPWNNNGSVVLEDTDIKENNKYERIALNKAQSQAPGFYIYGIKRLNYSISRNSSVLESEGWTKVTATSDLGKDKYYYALLDVSEAGYESGLALTGNTTPRPQYQIAANPLTNTEQSWTIASHDDGKYVLQCNKDSKYIYCNGAGWNTDFTDSKETDGTDFTFAVSDGKWTLSNEKDGSNFVGRWGSTERNPAHGESVAANKAASAGKKLFYIYSILTLENATTSFTSGSSATADTWYAFTVSADGAYKITSTNAATLSYSQVGTKSVSASFSTVNIAASGFTYLNLTAGTFYFKSDAGSTITIAKLSADADITSDFITNPSFETGNETGWTYTTSTDHGAKENNNATYTMSGVDGNYLFNIWATGYTISQTLKNLPAGSYKLTAVMGTDAGATFRLKMGDETGCATSVNKGTGVTVTVYAKLTAKGDLTISADAGGSMWYKVDNFQLTYNPTLPASLTAVEGKMNATVSSTQDTKVDTYNATNGQTIDNLIDAQSAIFAAYESKLVYNDITAIKESYDAQAALLDAAGQAAYATATATAETGATTKYTAGTYTTAAQAKTAYRADFVTAVRAQNTAGADWTGVLNNPDFEDTDMSGWDNTGATSGPNRENSGPAAYNGSWRAGFWNSNLTGTISIYQKNVNLPTGIYRLDFYAYNNGYNTNKWSKLQAYYGETTCSEQDYDSDARDQWKKYSFDFTVSEEATANLGVKFTPTSTGQIWENIDNFQLTYLAPYYAVDADYTDLSAAITSAEGRTLGFENGEYAPYNNTEILAKLDEAKDIRDESPRTNHVRSDIQTLISDLESDGNWNANDGEVNAFCGGDFSQYETISSKDYPYGWNLYNGADNHSRIMGGSEGSANKGLSATSSGKALLLKYNATYGETEGYTMPLKAGKIYKITFKHGRWAEANPRVTNVKMTDPNGTSITLTPGFQAATDNCQDEGGVWYTYTGYFASTTAGDYKFNFEKTLNGSGQNTQMQIAIGDIDLRTAENLTFGSDGSFPTFAAGTYPAVQLDGRTFNTTHWNTLCVPFAFAKSTFSEVKELTGITVTGDHISMAFGDASSTTAGKPYLVKTENSSVTFENVALDPSTTVSNTVVDDDGTNTRVTYVGTFSGTTLNSSDTDKWIVKSSMLYNVDSNVNVGAYRGYFTVGSTAGVKALFFDFDGETGINAIDNGQWTIDNAKIFNLAGQRLSRMQKGVNIVNGKKILVK